MIKGTGCDAQYLFAEDILGIIQVIYQDMQKSILILVKIIKELKINL